MMMNMKDEIGHSRPQGQDGGAGGGGNDGGEGGGQGLCWGRNE